MKSISSVGEIIPNVIKSIGLKKKYEQIQIMDDWNEIVGYRISEKARPIEVRRGVLRVGVESSAWMNELQLIKPELMGKIENRFGRNKIKDIRFCLGRTEKGGK